MPDEFVRKEVFDARMDRMEAIMEKTLMEMKADNEKLRSEMKEEISGIRGEMNGLRSEMREMGLELRSEIRALDTRVDSLQTWQYWQIVWIGILVAAVALIPAFTQYLRKKSEMTVEKARDLLERFVEASAAVSGAQQNSI